MSSRLETQGGKEMNLEKGASQKTHRGKKRHEQNKFYYLG